MVGDCKWGSRFNDMDNSLVNQEFEEKSRNNAQKYFMKIGVKPTLHVIK